MEPSAAIKAVLPDGWIVESLSAYGVVITAVEDTRPVGSVTVNEQKRGFKLGIVPVRENGHYSGRGWKVDLYTDAVTALQTALKR